MGQLVAYGDFLRARAARGRRAAALTLLLPWWPLGWLTPVEVTVGRGNFFWTRRER